MLISSERASNPHRASVHSTHASQNLSSQEDLQKTYDRGLNVARSKPALLQIAECAETGEMKSIYEVANGKACNCILPGTQVGLIARNKGKAQGQQLLPGQRIAHFALVKGANPQHAIESTIHKFAKRVFAQTKTLRLPEIESSWDWDFDLEKAIAQVIPIELPARTIEFYMEEGTKLANERLEEKFMEHVHAFGDVQLELKIESADGRGSVIADAVGYNKGKTKVLVEFHFTNAVSPEKKALIQTMDRSCVEVDLSSFVQLDEFGKLNRDGMITGLESKWGFRKHWVHNSKRHRIEQSVIVSVVKHIGARARKQLAIYKKERTAEYLKKRTDAGFIQKQVYHFKDGTMKVYCPKSAEGNEAAAMAGCRKCSFFARHHFAKKSDELRQTQPHWLSKHPEEMSVLCGFESDVKGKDWR